MEDLIKREDAINDLLADNDGVSEKEASAVMTCLADVIEVIKNIPSAELKRERCEYCKYGNFIGQRIMLGNDGEWHKILFCPNCGASMKGTSE